MARSVSACDSRVSAHTMAPPGPTDAAGVAMMATASQTPSMASPPVASRTIGVACNPFAQ